MSTVPYAPYNLVPRQMMMMNTVCDASLFQYVRYCTVLTPGIGTVRYTPGFGARTVLVPVLVQYEYQGYKLYSTVPYRTVSL